MTNTEFYQIIDQGEQQEAYEPHASQIGSHLQQNTVLQIFLANQNSLLSRKCPWIGNDGFKAGVPKPFKPGASSLSLRLLGVLPTVLPIKFLER